MRAMAKLRANPFKQEARSLRRTIVARAELAMMKPCGRQDAAVGDHMRLSLSLGNSDARRLGIHAQFRALPTMPQYVTGGDLFHFVIESSKKGALENKCVKKLRKMFSRSRKAITFGPSSSDRYPNSHSFQPSE
jgi:hypothetical protein